jgi:hypothetical protein
MSKTNVIRLSGLACIVFGALLSLTFLLRAVFPDPDPTTGSHVIVGTLRVLTAAFGILAFTGMYARQVEQAGKLGLAGYLFAFLGIAMVFGLDFSFTYLFPVFAIGVPEFVAQLDAGQIEPAGPIIVIFFLVDIVFLIGVILFGAATLRAGVLPRPAATVMLVGAIGLSISDYLPGFIAPTGALLAGLGFAWLGYALWSGAEEPTGQAAAPVTT